MLTVKLLSEQHYLQSRYDDDIMWNCASAHHYSLTCVFDLTSIKETNLDVGCRL